MSRRTLKPMDPSDIRAVRVYLCLTQCEMAAVLGLPEKTGGDTVRELERGERAPLCL